MKTGILSVSLLLAVASTTFASFESLSDDGINAWGVQLTGVGVNIGQVEPGRPGVAGYDSDFLTASNTTPFAVYYQLDSGEDDMDSLAIDDAPTEGQHATLVAGVMIGTDNGECNTCHGVAPDAHLYSIAVGYEIDDSIAASSINRLIAETPFTLNRIRYFNLCTVNLVLVI